MKTTCSHVRAMVQRCLDGDVLVQDEQNVLDDHLATCAACRAFERDLDRIVGVIEHLPPAAFPAPLVARVMCQASAPRTARSAPGWPGQIVRLWAPLAGLAGLAMLIYQMIAVRGLSLLNLPGAFAEWLSMIDMSHLESLVQATSLFSWSVGVELLLGVSLVMVAVFAMAAQAMTKPPTMGMPARR